MGLPLAIRYPVVELAAIQRRGPLSGGSHFLVLSHTMSKSGQTSASRFATIHLGTSLTESSSNNLRHVPQTWMNTGVAIEHAAPGKAEVGQDRRLVAVQAEQRGRPPPGRLQRRPGDAIRLDAIPGVSRPGAGRRRPVVRLFLIPPLPLSPVHLPGQNGGSRSPKRKSSPGWTVLISRFRSIKTTLTPFRARPCCLKKGRKSPCPCWPQ